MNIQEKITSIEREIRETPYHKATERHIGKLKARLSKLHSLLYEQRLQGKRGGTDFTVRKTGDATVVLVGPPSVGKSTLINALTGARSKVAEYEFTTLKVIPGIMNYNGAKIQILDVPGLVKGAAQGFGRGREILSVVRIADLILLMTDVGRINRFEKMQKELYSTGIRLNQTPPKVRIEKKNRAGVVLNSSSLSYISKISVKDIVREFGLLNAEITIEENLTVDRLIDALDGNRVYIPGLRVVNKMDLLKQVDAGRMPNVLPPDVIKISAGEKKGLDNLRDKIWEKLGLIRIYLKNKGREVDYGKPMIVKDEIAVREAAEKISTELSQKVKGARIWGQGAAFSGQIVGLNYRLWDEIIIHFIS